MRSRATVQSPAGYDAQNLTAAKLGQRLAAGSNAALRTDIRAALQDTGYRYSIHPYETSKGLVEADLVFGFDPGNVYRYGAALDGVTDDTVALQRAALVSDRFEMILEIGNALITGTVAIPDFGKARGRGRESIVTKGANGDMLTMGRHARVQDFRMVGSRASFTGRGVVISTGINTPTLAQQGHQLLESVVIDDMAGYPVEYTGGNSVGWDSIIRRCQISNYNTDAAIKWADEAVSGGNRQVLQTYTSDASVNVGGCDNGIIAHCFMGNSAGINGGIIWPAGTTNRAKKVLVTDNRIAMGDTMTVRGIDCVLSNNVIGGSVVFASNAASDGAQNCTWDGDSNVLTGTFTDSSVAANKIFHADQIAFTPTWTSSGSAPAFGDADVRCNYTRRGGWVRAKYFIKFGSTTTFGTGFYNFSLPKAVLDSGTTDYVGPAFLKDRSGVCRTLLNVGSSAIGLYSDTAPVTHSSPIAWASGDVLMFEVEYKIHA